MGKNVINEVIDLMKRMEDVPGGYTGLINEGNSEKLWPMEIWNGYVVLRHCSPIKIKNGVISSSFGKTNSYTPRGSFGNYFWGSSVNGKDNSNIHDIEYICLVPQESVYDFMKNEKGYETDSDALSNEKYIAYNWKVTPGAVVVRSTVKTPISYIDYRPKSHFGNEIDGLYDSNWKLLRTYGFVHEKRWIQNVLKKLKLTKDVVVPDFLIKKGSYDYETIFDYYEKNKKTLTSNYWSE